MAIARVQVLFFRYLVVQLRRHFLLFPVLRSAFLAEKLGGKIGKGFVRVRPYLTLGLSLGEALARLPCPAKAAEAFFFFLDKKEAKNQVS